MPNRAQRRAQKFAAVQQKSSIVVSQAVAAPATPAEVETAPVAAPLVATASPSAAYGFAPTPAVMPEIARPTVTITENERTRKINVTPAKLEANQANAQLSCGPVTEAGKARSSMNAVKTGLTGRTILLPTDDVAVYQAHLDRHFTDFDPATEAERVLVQLIADAEWRILRISSLEASIWAHGLYSLSHLFADVKEENTRQHYLYAEIMKQYRKEFANLTLQENRLTRLQDKHTAELKRIQDLRRHNEKNDLEAAGKLVRQAINEKKPIDLYEFGFDFSKTELLQYLDLLDRRFQATGTRPSFRKVLKALRAAPKAA